MIKLIPTENKTPNKPNNMFSVSFEIVIGIKENTKEIIKNNNICFMILGSIKLVSYYLCMFELLFRFLLKFLCA